MILVQVYLEWITLIRHHPILSCITLEVVLTFADINNNINTNV